MARVVVTLFVLAAAGMVGAYVFLGLSTRAELRAIVDRLHAEGLPATPQELDAYYDFGEEGREAGQAYVEAFDLYDDSLEDVDVEGAEDIWDLAPEPTEPGEPIKPDSLEAAEQHLAANKEYLKRLHELAATVKDVRYPAEFWRGWGVEFSYLRDIRTAARMLALEAFYASARGDTGRATTALMHSLKVADSLRGHPLLIPQLVRDVCLGISCGALEKSVNRASFSENQLGSLQSALEDVDVDGATVTGMIGEPVLALSYMDRRLRSMAGVERQNPEYVVFPSRRQFALRGYMERVMLRNIRQYPRIIEIGELPPWERKAAGDTIIQKIERDSWITNVLASITVPPLVGGYDAENRTMAQLATARVALAALRYSLAERSTPEGLKDLKPAYLSEIPLDPFDGEPLRYRRTDTGFVVYSLGHDRDDDGGVPPPEGTSLIDDGDIVFRVLDVGRYLVDTAEN